MISLKEFKRLDRKEICIRLNEMNETKNHYDPAVMAENGYDFSWASMKKVAEEMNFSFGFFDVENPQETGTPKEVVVNLKDKDSYAKKTLYLDKGTVPVLEKLLCVGGTYGNAALLSAIIGEGCKVFERANHNGKVKFVAPRLEAINGANAQE